MAYNYDEFMKAASAAGMLNRFSEADLGAVKSNPEFGYSMLQMYQNRDKATTAEQRLLADETANQLRKSYGVTPGQPEAPTYGNIPAMAASAGPASIEADTLALYERMSKPGTVPAGGSSPVVKSKTSKSTGTGPAFDYDPEKDPRMAAYRKTYLREAERAREDTLAKAAAATGGIPSSYAIGAADQAGNYFVSQLTDKIPELYNDAYNQQLQEWEKALAIYQIMGDNTPQGYLDVLGVKKKKKKKDSGGSSTGSNPKPKEEPTNDTANDDAYQGEAMSKAEKAKKIHEAVANGDITPNQAQALLKQL